MESYGTRGLSETESNLLTHQMTDRLADYYRGNGSVLGATIIFAPTSLGLRFYLKRQNKIKKLERDSEISAQLRMLDAEEMGTWHPDFLLLL